MWTTNFVSISTNWCIYLTMIQAYFWIILNVPKVAWHFNKRKQLSHAFVICNWASLLQAMKDRHKQQIFLLIFNLQSNIYLVNYKTSYMHCCKLLHLCSNFLFWHPFFCWIGSMHNETQNLNATRKPQGWALWKQKEMDLCTM